MDREMAKKEAVQAIKNFFEAHDWHYEYDEEKLLFRAGVGINSKLANLRIFLRVSDIGVSLHACIPNVADKGCRSQVAEYLTMANYGLRNGNFELDMKDGEIRYKLFYPCMDGAPSQNTIEYMIITGCSMFEQYGDDLLAVMFGLKTVQEAIEAAEQERREG